MTNKKKFTLLLGLLSLLFTINMVESTYAKYASKTTTTAKMNVARWDIIVNGEYVKDSQTLTASITPEYIDNPNVAPGVIAPGSVGYFDITIDPSDTDVSFSYDINIEPAETSSVADLKLLKYYIDDESNTVDIINNISNVHGEITLNNKVSQTVRVFIIWDDDAATESMNNISDTEIGHSADPDTIFGDIKVAMKFTQIK